MTMTFLCTVPLQRVSRDSVTIISAFIIIIIIIIIISPIGRYAWISQTDNKWQTTETDRQCCDNTDLMQGMWR